MLIAGILFSTPLFASGQADNKAPFRAPTSDRAVVVTGITTAPGAFTFRAREFTAEEAPGKPENGKLTEGAYPLINIDIHGVDKGGVSFPFNEKEFSAREQPVPYVLVVIPSKLISTATGGALTAATVKDLKFWTVDPATKKGSWTSFSEAKGDFADWGKTQDYVWFVVTGWPPDDRLIACV
jgi:hypothetical protein